MKMTRLIYLASIIIFLGSMVSVFIPKNNLSQKGVTPIPTLIPTTKPTLALSGKTVLTPTPDTRCIISVNGQKYDVTDFRTQHSGGDVFNCGTDMTSVFNSQHGQRYLQMLEPFKI